MSKWAFLTPDEHDLTDTICRTIKIPNAPEWLALVTGALSLLTHDYNWEKRGTAEPEDCAAYFSKALSDMIDTLGDCMIGTVIASAREFAPVGYLSCDGAEYLRQDYPLLYEAIHQEFRTGPDTFVVPDLLDRQILGEGVEWAMGDRQGDMYHTLTEQEMPIHTHTTVPHDHDTVPHQHAYTGIATPDLLGAVPGPAMQALPNLTSASGVTVLPNDITVNNAGGGIAFLNQGAFFCLRFFIKAE